jgi:hypothetical protein
MPDGRILKVAAVSDEKNIIWTTEKPTPPKNADKVVNIRAVTDSSGRSELSRQLMQRVFTNPDLALIPASWGRSAISLGKRMTLVRHLDLEKAVMKNMAKVNDSLVLIGDAASMTIDLSADSLAGADAGILGFSFAGSQNKTCRLRISWWGDGMKGPDPELSFWITARNDKLIIPLDSHPGWLMMKKVTGMQIELFPADGKGSFRIDNGILYQRLTAAAENKTSGS